ncbi:MAG: TonB-dependent receptor domain-containing protein [Fidelibacterota bacterium]
MANIRPLRRVALLSLFTQLTWGQNTFEALVKDENTGDALQGVDVFFRTLGVGGTTDREGIVKITGVPDGSFTVSFSYIGYKPYQTVLSFPRAKPEKILTVLLTPEAVHLRPVTVTTTRTGNRIDDTPVRVEVLGREEVNEEVAIRPGNIAKLLGEASGVQVQQTSASSGNVSFRLQGLPGKYTQLLKDGFPVYSGFLSGLSLLQIPPLDLDRVEVIKGSLSSFYGGDAIAGIVNLISRAPSRHPEWFLLLNMTHKGGRDISTYYSRGNGKMGLTLLASRNTQKGVDVDGDGFTDLPEFQQVSLGPRFFYAINETTSLIAGLSSTLEDRRGGDLAAIEKSSDSLHTFIEENRSTRVTSQLKLEKRKGRNQRLTFKNSVSYFRRHFSTATRLFSGTQLFTYSEVSGLRKTGYHDTVLGINVVTETTVTKRSREESMGAGGTFTAGMFVHDSWRVRPRVTLQAGIRADYHSDYGLLSMPSLSLLHKFSDTFYIRAGGGFGYRTPSLLGEETRGEPYPTLSHAAGTLRPESSRGETLDINYRSIISGRISLTLNQAFYHTRVNHALIPEPDSLARGVLLLENARGPLETGGMDTNIHITWDELEMFADYTYTRARKGYDPGKPDLELTPRHKLNITLSFEEEGVWRAGMEAFYTGKQVRSDQTQTPAYWTIGAMAQKYYRRFSIIANVENVFDVRQSRYEDVVLPPYRDPVFRELWAPLDGTVANVALKIYL